MTKKTGKKSYQHKRTAFVSHQMLVLRYKLADAKGEDREGLIEEIKMLHLKETEENKC